LSVTVLLEMFLISRASSLPVRLEVNTATPPMRKLLALVRMIVVVVAPASLTVVLLPRNSPPIATLSSRPRPPWVRAPVARPGTDVASVNGIGVHGVMSAKDELSVPNEPLGSS
jgi:hypothetical protein